MRGPIRTHIEAEGQKYVDMPVYIKPTPMCDAVRKAFGIPVMRRILVGYARYPLNWDKKQLGAPYQLLAQ